MLDPREYCFWCMNKLASANGVCPVCGKDNRSRKNGEGELPFSLVARKYIVGHALGRGGFGITYIGLNMMLSKRVAIKEYFPQDISRRSADGINVQASSPETAGQFEEGKRKALEEARIIARVQNVSNVVGVYDCFSRNNTVYIIMEYLEGETFASRVGRKGPRKWKEIWPELRPVGVALGQLHRLKLIHRDISPDNIMIRNDTGENILLDFGAASGIVAKGQTRASVLKDGYAATEMYQEQAEINGRADEYAWSATLWYILTGQRPPSAQQRRMQNSEMKAPSGIRRKMPEAVWKALRKGMALRPEDRYPAMEDMIRDLDRAGTGSSGSTAVLVAAAAVAFAVLVVSVIAGVFL